MIPDKAFWFVADNTVDTGDYRYSTKSIGYGLRNMVMSLINRMFLIYGCQMGLVICLVFPSYVNAQSTLQLGGSGTDLGTMKRLAKEFEKANSGISVHIPPSLGSSGGVRALLANRLDIAITSRPLKAQEKSAALRAFQYAQTALVLATSSDNAINNISTEQLKAIYSGALPYWPGGGVARPILRPQSDSDIKLLLKHVPGLKVTMDLAYARRGIPIATTDQDSADQIETIPGAIGTSTLALILAEKRKIKPLGLDGIQPSIENIKLGKYTMIKDLYIIIPAQPGDITKQFLRFMNSETGRTILEKTGHLAIPFSL